MHPLHFFLLSSLSLPPVLAGFAIAVTANATTAQQPAPSDARIAETIEDELARDHAIAARSIHVAVDDGIVTLSGSTDNLQSSDRAAAIARTVRGVRSVVHLLTVARIDPMTAKDLETLVTAALHDDPATDAYEVRVQADDQGKVQIQGTVQSWAERQLCAQVVAGVRGVTALENTIAVNHLAAHDDREIVAEIQERLRWNILIDDEHIKVECRDGDVSLSGTVGSAAERFRARGLAEVAGVRSVHAEGLQVAHWQRNPMFRRSKYAVRSNDQIQAAVQTALQLDPRVAAGQVTVHVDQGKVTLRGVVDSLKAARAVREDALETVGVSLVTSRLRVAPKTKRSATAVAQAALEAIERDPYLGAGEVSVTVKNGVAHLFGRVDTNYERMRADDAAARTLGVLDVKNLIAVRDDRFLNFDPQVDRTPIYTFPWYHFTPWRSFDSDTEIHDRIMEELWWSPFVNSGDVDVQVSDGIATLTGDVASRAEILSATDNAFDGGAVWVDNRIRVLAGKAAVDAGPGK